MNFPNTFFTRITSASALAIFFATSWSGAAFAAGDGVITPEAKAWAETIDFNANAASRETEIGESAFFKTDLIAYNDAWSPGPTSRFDIDVPAPFYQQTNRLFAFDLFPPAEGFQGWDAYAEELSAIVARSLEFEVELRPETFRYARNGDVAWMSASIDTQGKTLDGTPYGATARQSVVLEKIGDRWLVAHEHISVPYVPGAQQPEGTVDDNEEASARSDILDALQGTWASTGIEDRANGARVTRRFTFDDDRWTMALTGYSWEDAPLYTLVYSGEVTIGDPVTNAATEADFGIDAIVFTRLTADDAAFAATGLDGNGVTLGQTIDISATGNGWVHPIGEVDTDYDIVRVEGDVLQFGQRPADGSGLDTQDKRPTALNPAVVDKI